MEGPADNSGGGPVERRSASLLYKIFHASPSPISISSLADGRLVEVNEEWARFFGHEIDEAVGQTMREMDFWVDRGRYAEIRARLEEHESVHDEEVDVRIRSGEVRTVLLSAQVIDVAGEPCVLKVMSDITERKRSLLAMKESEERFHMLADSAPVLIWMSEGEGPPTYFNKPWLRFVDAPLSTQRQGGWIDSVHPDDRKTCVHAFESALADRTPFEREYRLRRGDGEYRWMLDKAVPRYRPDDSFAGYVGSCTDINEQKETERALTEAKVRAEEMSQLKATFLTNITHEIRTPLTVILGFTSILRQGVRSEYQRFVNLIERSGRRLLLMLDSMLDLAQLESGTIQIEAHRFNVADIVEGVAAIVRPQAEEKGLDLDVHVDESRHYARIDHAILTRVLNNILDNAIKFTDEGSVEIHVSRKNDEISVVISDTGIGIEDKFLPHVFDSFVQESTGLDRSHQGSGLGLSVSKRLIELMGGTITLESEKRVGSVFTIVLPAAG